VEPAYSYIVYSRFTAIIALKLAPIDYNSLLFYPSCSSSSIQKSLIGGLRFSFFLFVDELIEIVND